VQPLLLVFEDLHWIDAETQALLDSLIESLPTARLLLLVNYRPEYQHGWGSKTYYTQLRLDPLPPASAEAVLNALLGQDPSLMPLKRLLIERTEGNPFFLEESVRTLAESRVLVGEPDAYRLAQALPTIQVPATVQAVLAARIDRLPPEEKQLLQAAAVIGTEVPLPLLRAIAELPETVLHRGLVHLQAAEFLYETRLFPECAYTFKHALTQQVAYQSLLTSTRQRYHAQLAQVLEARFPETVETQPELLAHHYTEAGLNAQAVGHWQRAGQRAVERSANLETVAHLTKGLELLTTLPDTSDRAQQELVIQTTLGSALIAVKGFAAPEVLQTYARARELCRQVGDTPQLFQVLRGLWYFYMGRLELQTARELGEQLLTLAQQAGDPALLLEAHYALGNTVNYLGEFVAAQAHFAQGIVLYDPQRHRVHTFRYGQNSGVMCHAYAAWTLWWLGYPDQALQRSHEALTLARELAHSYSLAVALFFAAMFHQLRREGQLTQERAEAARAFAAEQGFALWVAGGTFLRGWALAEQSPEAVAGAGPWEEGVAQMHQGLAAWCATGAEVARPYMLALLAETSAQGGQREEGLPLLAEALAMTNDTEERRWEAELYRLKGELLLQQAAPDAPPAEACFQQALAIARRQQAKSWELRTAMSLARLWQQQGKRAAARQLLAEIYGWFTEGFDTPDLQEAKALLEALT
jgi:predicted ATPase